MEARIPDADAFTAALNEFVDAKVKLAILQPQSGEWIDIGPRVPGSPKDVATKRLEAAAMALRATLKAAT